MAVKTIPDTRQYPLAVYAPFSYEDALGVADAVLTLFALPQASIITAIDMYLTTAFASGGGTHDCIVGDVTDTNEYSATNVELDAAAIPANPPAVSGFTTTSSEPDVLLTIIDGTGVATSGVGYLYAQYIQVSRATENYE